MSRWPDGARVAVIGATGGIGAAVVQALLGRPDVAEVHACARQIGEGAGKLRWHPLELTDEASIASAAAAIGAPLHLVLVATGELRAPEKSWAQQSAEAYARAFAINAIGPALVGKHFLPLLARDQGAVFAALAARVGSIADNRLGGWHAYRASKAALVMVVRNFALELAARNRAALAVTLHPGTVETALSAPFAGARDKMTPAIAAHNLLRVIDGLDPSHNGLQIGWDGTVIPG